MRSQSAAGTSSAIRLPVARSPRNRISAFVPRRDSRRYADFGDDERWHEQGAGMVFEQTEAGFVVLIVRVDVGV